MGQNFGETGDWDFGGGLGTRKIETSPEEAHRDEAFEPSLVVMAGGRLAEYCPIPKNDSLVIGRSVEADLVLGSRSVSRKHARVYREGNRIMIEDLGSANGIEIDGRIIDEPAVLEHGTLVRRGTASVNFFSSPTDESGYHAKLVEVVTRDELTGLHNRSFFSDSLQKMFPFHANLQRPLTVAMIDLDHFKQVNDEHGHDVGDRVLSLTGMVLRDGVRKQDVVARIGGEEFAILFHCADSIYAMQELLRLKDTLVAETANATGLTVTFSAGIASTMDFSDRSRSIARLMKAADEALYQAKRAGRNRVEVAKD